MAERRAPKAVRTLRIGTWNLAGRWGPEHLDLLLGLDCDVVLLTEVSDRVEVPEYVLHATEHEMARRRHWAGVLARDSELTPLPDPHPASALATVGGWTFCSSILPWRSCGQREPWVGDGHADRTAAAVRSLTDGLPRTRLVWGGDWNHALTGREYAGSIGGRAHLTEAVQRLDLKVLTAALPHQIPRLLSIDHIAVPTCLSVLRAERVSAISADRRLSDHDAYIVEIARPPRSDVG